MSQLAAALMVAIRVHASAVDKQGEPYLLHVLRVVEAVSDEAKVVAALHDVLEDAEKPGICLADLVGVVYLSAIEEGALHALTRGDGESYAGYIDTMTGGGPAFALAREVKLADLRDNLGRIPSPDLLLSFAPVDRDKVAVKWASLKTRYERAIETLEATR